MIYVNYLALAVATFGSFVFSVLYYMILNRQVVAARASRARNKDDTRTATTPNKIIIELIRTFLTGLIVAYAIALLNLLYLDQAILLAVWLWLGFPVVLLIGMVIHEHFSAKLAVIHAGDWLARLLILSITLTLWY